MLYAVVPACNEGERITRVILTLLAVPVDKVVVVVNGSTDDTLEKVRGFPLQRVKPLFFPEPLGHDVPRAVGALYARRYGARGVLFVDGDMAAIPVRPLRRLKEAVLNQGVDLALTDCYPPQAPPPPSPVTQRLLFFRQQLNLLLGMEHLGSASPSHGPLAVSHRFLEKVPLEELAVPPVILVYAARAGLRVEVVTSIPHKLLGSPSRGKLHSTLIAATIIGDYLEAIALATGRPRSRKQEGVYYDGYHSSRRWDLLRRFSAQEIT
ncbi:glycosyl transferase family 2 [Ammonifex degensii KC4]|uniref:Glycosyl transferase family 2 n=1 Tax=Ammonifex degensii (strain DSM 10501 / KC4) TaxID=429009 RepID=C9RA57_AMMDK|nr:glycosyltransferase family A protein [Ammonifex degensii]ACX53186.1 glycosyl transferase family 2 [Ammonifex degensii KC4]